jgi:hypothetical protein
MPFCIWLGVLGWGLQGLMEFGLYIPAMAWPGFTFLGWLAGNAGSLRTSGVSGREPECAGAPVAKSPSKHQCG